MDRDISMLPNGPRRLLIVAFEFPPCNGASVQRILSVYEHFISIGWTVDVLTAAPFTYEKLNPNPTNDLMPTTGKIIRAPALDVMRHLAFKGKHLGALIRPDRWGLTWIPLAKAMAVQHVKRTQPDVIWSSSPIPSVHEIARTLKKKCDALWVADYRDPMSHLQGSENNFINKQLKRIDHNTVTGADLLTFATDAMCDLYVSQYNQTDISNKCAVIKNGFVERRFATAAHFKPLEGEIFNLYYAGVLYENGRDPAPLFRAMAKFKATHPGTHIKLTLQGAGDGAPYAEIIKNLSLEDNVAFMPSTDFDNAIINMMKSDALVLIQGERFNNQIPGKLYEYLRTGRSILLNTPEGSATDQESRLFPGIYQCDNDNTTYISLCKMVSDKHTAWDRDLTAFSREYQAKKLEELIVPAIMEKKK